MSQLAEAIGLIGSHDLARWAYGALLPYRSRFAVEGIGAAIRGPVERDLGVLAATLGERSAAADHFGAAVAATRRIGAPLLTARTLHDMGTSLGDSACLDDARSAYAALGADRRVADIDARDGGRRDRPPAGQPEMPVFRRDGEVWRIGFRGREVTLRDSKGLRDIAVLVGRPGRPVPALDLAGDLAAPPREGDLGEVLDARARESYRRRIVELDEEIELADAAADAARSSRAIAERDTLVAELSAAYGLGGRPRRAGDPAERARSTVTARIRESLKRLEGADEALGSHLRRSIRTGRLCVYEPE
jgi:hypothetical protein